ncbi:hypothetical protein [Aneurinibacillus sp. UBA3580]|uniref:hypothetical protein n=1 Tax=Aneurinibacillus sp. UBA3580 TaxID=1946041 RepID=UPI00257A6DA8|nr:hypothetical protein [Aneurinibacillus sp. UBA3580]
MIRAVKKAGKRMIRLAPFLLCASLLTGCSEEQETLVYVGQSDNWKAILMTVHTQGTEKEKQVLRLSYKSADIDSVYNIRYRLTGLTEEVSGRENDMNNKTGIVYHTDCSGCALTDESSTFTVTVDWSPNRKESFSLQFVRKE